jgi:transposase InsO family protein
MVERTELVAELPARRIGNKPTETPPRTVTAKYPHHVWNIDHTVVPTAAGFWVPWIPFSFLMSWPFCWWLTVVMDHFSRKVVAFEAFAQQPSEEAVCQLLDRAVGQIGRAPKYTVTDQGVQFRQKFRDWCQQHGVKPRFGAVGQSGSIAILERFMLTLKDECTRRILVPYSIDAMRVEVARFLCWYAEVRPHEGLGGRTPSEVYENRVPARDGPRFEPRPRYPATANGKETAALRARRGVKLELVVSSFESAEHLPLVELKEAA